MDYILFIILVIFIISIIVITSKIKTAKKLEAKLLNSFGKIPSQKKYIFESIDSYHKHKQRNSDNSYIIDNNQIYSLTKIK